MRIVLYFITFICCQQILYTQNSEYLLQIGKKDSLFSNVLNESREIYVQLPKSYQLDTKQKYPVVYVIDGEVFLPTVANVHSFYSGGYMPEMVIVGISNSNNRTRDLTTSKIETQYGRPYKGDSGGAGNFLKFIEDELIPYIEDNYRVSDYRTLVGHSYGGLFTLYALTNHSDVFDNYISIDPSLDWDNQKLLKETNVTLSNIDFSGKALFMTLSGQLHMQNEDITITNVMNDTTDFTLFARSNIKLSKAIKDSDSNMFFEWQFYPNDLHGTIPHSSIKDGLISLFGWYQMENTNKINNPESSIEELLDIIKYRELKLLKHFGYKEPPYPEFLLNMSGYMNMDMGQVEKAKMYFEQAIKYYPHSVNVYESMSDFYLSQNNKKQAIGYLQKAYTVSGDSKYQQRIKDIQD